MQRVFPPPPTRGVGQRTGQGPFAAGADPEPDHIAEDRMGQQDLQTPAVHATGDGRPVLERGHGGRIGQLVQGRLGQRLGQGDQLQDVAFRLADRARAAP